MMSKVDYDIMIVGKRPDEEGCFVLLPDEEEPEENDTIQVYVLLESEERALINGLSGWQKESWWAMMQKSTTAAFNLGTKV